MSTGYRRKKYLIRSIYTEKIWQNSHVIYDKTFSKLGMKENHFNPLNYIPSKYRANIIFNGERDS